MLTFADKKINLGPLNFPELYQQFLTDIKLTTWYEYLAVFTGILSVWYSRRENILVYPVGLINTIIYVYISLEGQLIGEASVNLYYTIMNIVGWYWWTRKDVQNRPILEITSTSKKEWMIHLSFFATLYLVIFLALTYFKNFFFDGVIPWADALASAAAFTGMWLMTKKKTESWYWWLLTNIVSIPLYFVKHYVFTSIYYVVLFILAIAGLIEWKKREKARSL